MPEPDQRDNADLNEIRAERDALHRELADLRAHLSMALGLPRTPGPKASDARRAASDKEIVAAVRKLIADSPEPKADDAPRWSAIDRLILDGRKIQAIQQIRLEFGGSLHDALDMLVVRYDRLRLERSDEFAQDREEYWDGFHS